MFLQVKNVLSLGSIAAKAWFWQSGDDPTCAWVRMTGRRAFRAAW
jgi:hypothetical protein